jgi:hypothetical protein
MRLSVHHCGISQKNVPNLRHTNEVVDAYVNTGARINLYKYLERLQERALYCDTDSVIFIQPDDQPALIETGDCHRSMTSELKPGIHIDELVIGGPKNYAYRTVNRAIGERETECKVRGITLNYNASDLVNFCHTIYDIASRQI